MSQVHEPITCNHIKLCACILENNLIIWSLGEKAQKKRATASKHNNHKTKWVTRWWHVFLYLCVCICWLYRRHNAVAAGPGLVHYNSWVYIIFLASILVCMCVSLSRITLHLNSFPQLHIHIHEKYYKCIISMPYIHMLWARFLSALMFRGGVFPGFSLHFCLQYFHFCFVIIHYFNFIFILFA